MKVAVFGDTMFSIDMAWGFAQLGHEVRMINPRTARQAEEIVSAGDTDLLVTLGSPAWFKDDVLDQLGSVGHTGLKYVHWDTDGITWLDIEMNHIRRMQPDFVFTVCPDMRDYLRGQGVSAELLSYAYSPLSHHPAEGVTGHEGRVTFVGSSYPSVVLHNPYHYRRISMDVLFKPLLKEGRRIDFYGDDYHKTIIRQLYGFNMPEDWLHGRIKYEKLYEIYSGCAINLVTQNHEETITKRLFEILGSGGFALSFDNNAVRRQFVPGKELAVASSSEQTIELIEYYTKNTEEYKRIRENALVAARKHTYDKRAEAILQLTGAR
jgi:spore maturation protein CgeB